MATEYTKSTKPYLSGRAMPGLTGIIIGRGWRIMCGGPGIICMGPPIGGLIPPACDSDGRWSLGTYLRPTGKFDSFNYLSIHFAALCLTCHKHSVSISSFTCWITQIGFKVKCLSPGPPGIIPCGGGPIMGIMGGPPIGGVGSMPGRGGPVLQQTANVSTQLLPRTWAAKFISVAVLFSSVKVWLFPVEMWCFTSVLEEYLRREIYIFHMNINSITKTLHFFVVVSIH